MTNEIATRIEELKSLGWSDTGVEVYSQQLLKGNLPKELISHQEILIILIIIFLGFLTSIALLLTRKVKEKKREFPIQSKNPEPMYLKEETAKIGKEGSKAIKKKTKAPFIGFIIKEFKSTAIKPGTIIEHVLLITIISFEFILRLTQELHQDYFKVKNNQKKAKEFIIINKSPTIAMEERKKQLIQKTNLELRNYLKGVPYVSKMKKKDLVTKILLLEFKS